MKIMTDRTTMWTGFFRLSESSSSVLAPEKFGDVTDCGDLCDLQYASHWVLQRIVENDFEEYIPCMERIGSPARASKQPRRLWIQGAAGMRVPE